MTPKNITALAQRYRRAVAIFDAAKAAYNQEVAGIVQRFERKGPVAVGTRVETNGYCRRGKMIEVERGEISQGFRWGREPFDISLIATGKVIKGDGTPGKQEGTREIKIDAVKSPSR